MINDILGDVLKTIFIALIGAVFMKGRPKLSNIWKRVVNFWHLNCRPPRGKTVMIAIHDKISDGVQPKNGDVPVGKKFLADNGHDKAEKLDREGKARRYLTLTERVWRIGQK